MQKVVRTVPTRKGYWYDEEKMEYLSELLKNGWKVVMCNRIGEDIEYIVEKEEPCTIRTRWMTKLAMGYFGNEVAMKNGLYLQGGCRSATPGTYTLDWP